MDAPFAPIRPTNRWIAAPLVALIAALSALFPPAASAATETPRIADSFVDSIGVNTHTYYDDTVYYSRFDGVKAKLAELGVRHVRENLVPDRPDQYERLRELAGIGVRSTLIMGDPTEGTAGLDELVRIARDELRGAIGAVEGSNEFDTWGGSNWIGDLRPYQQRLYAKVKSDPALAGLPVVGPSIVHRRSQEALGDISGDLDYGNIHSYPDGYSPEDNLDNHLSWAANNSGSKAVMATESGYHTATGWTGEHNPVSEAAMATYVPRMFLEYYRRGIARTFSYELLDEAANSGEREDSFGLLRNDLSEKPAYTALRNTIDILEDPGPGFSPSPVAYDLDGGEDVHHLLLQKRDGSFYLALWRAVDVIDPESQATLAAPSEPVTIEFSRQVTGAVAYRPNVSNAPVATLPVGGGRSLSVDTGPQVTIVKLTLGGKQATGRIKAWVSRKSVPAGGRVAVKGRLPKQLAGRSQRVKIQQWNGRAWRTVGHSRTKRSGAFRKKIRVLVKRNGRASRVRVVAKVAKPSRSLKVRIRR